MMHITTSGSLPYRRMPILGVIFVDLIDIISVCSVTLCVEKLQVALVIHLMLKSSSTGAIFCIWFHAKVFETMNLVSMFS